MAKQLDTGNFLPVIFEVCETRGGTTCSNFEHETAANPMESIKRCLPRIAPDGP